MKVVWKFSLLLQAHNDVEMPKGAEVVHVAAQFEKPCLWVLCDPEAEKETRRFGLATTGQTWDERESRYVGTFMLGGGSFLGHILEPNSAADSRKA